MKNNQQRGVDGPQPGANFFVLTIQAKETPAVAIFGPRLFGSVIFLRPYRACSFGMRSWIIGSWSWVSVDVALHGLSLGFEDLGWGMGCGSMHPVSN